MTNIIWSKTSAELSGQIVEVETTLDRFYLYPVNGKFGLMIDMWCLFDAITQTQHFIKKGDASLRVNEILQNKI